MREALLLTGSLFFSLSLRRAGHYGRALEDAIASHKNQWPASWSDKSPLSGGGTFSSLSPTERVSALLLIGERGDRP